MMASQKEEFNELSFYTLAHPDMIYFIHQHAVDAFQAQCADKSTKQIGLVFSLAGLYLFLEKGYTGRQVQQAHMRLAQNKKAWPQLGLPEQRGAITVSDVLKSEPGQARDQMIKAWCSSVWSAYKDWHNTIEALAKTELGVV
jgi:hypothetical protein